MGIVVLSDSPDILHVLKAPKPKYYHKSIKYPRKFQCTFPLHNVCPDNISVIRQPSKLAIWRPSKALTVSPLEFTGTEQFWTPLALQGYTSDTSRQVTASTPLHVPTLYSARVAALSLH